MTDPPGQALWRAIASGAAPPRDVESRASAARFAELLSPALADHLLGPGLIDPAAAAHSRLLARFHFAQQRKWAKAIVDAGIDAVFLKGFGAALAYYQDPEVRVIGDLDLLVRVRDRDRLIALLGAQGFRFQSLPTRIWGSFAGVSYMPFVSADGACNVDIHIEPDSWPAYRSLSAELVFGRAVTAGAEPFRVPCPEHNLLLAVTNAAKDKFGVYTVRKMVDGLVLINRTPVLDWAAIADIAARGRFRKPLKVFLALLVRLGLDPERVPAGLARPPRLGAREFARLVDDFARLFPQSRHGFAVFRRETLLCAEPTVEAGLMLRRLAGIAKPSSGVPAAGKALTH